MDDFQGELLARLPLGSAALDLFAYALDERFLGGVFEAHRGRCYERELSFASLVYLIRDALLCHGGSGQASFEAAGERDELPVAAANAYAKLGRVPAAVSMALLAEGAGRLVGLLPGGMASPVPRSLAGLEVVAVDGKKLKRAAKRLKVLRGLPGKLLGAKLLVALDVHRGLAVAMNVDWDGERNDVPLVPGLLPQVRAKLGGRGPILWMADSQFCDLNLPALFAQEGGHFLLRYTNKLSFHPDPNRPAREGVDGQGRRFVQEWGWVGAESEKRRRYVRRVTLVRPGEGDVAVITDLLDEMLYPAEDLLELYLLRWGIEQVFQQVTEVFELRKLIGSTPQAGAFQAALCLLMYDLVVVCRAYAAQAAGRVAAEVSGEKLLDDMRRELIAWAKVGDPAALPPPPTPEQLRASLARRIGGAWTDRWLKKRNKNRRRPTAKARRSGAHTSVWRVLEAHRAAQQKLVRS
jgi:DDE family transposase